MMQLHKTGIVLKGSKQATFTEAHGRGTRLPHRRTPGSFEGFHEVHSDPKNFASTHQHFDSPLVIRSPVSQT